MKYTIIIPNRYPDIIQPCIASISRFERDSDVVIIADGHKESYGYHMIPYTLPVFQYAKAVNLGIKWSLEHRPDNDIILMNDDCQFIEMESLDRLKEVIRLIPKIGILSPLIKGCAGNPVQRLHERAKWWRQLETVKLVWDPDVVCFPFICLRSSMVALIGLMDENIVGYGGEDDEYCSRARRYNWWTAVTSTVSVQHGDGSSGLIRGKSWSTSFVRPRTTL